VQLTVVLAVFPVIFLGELPDKTMFASLVMATRGRGWVVWCGSATAFLVHVAIATTIGVTMFRVLPHRVVEGAVAVLFFAGAGYALFEARRDTEQLAEHEETVVERTVTTHRRAFSTAFIVIFLAEWGDLTQILTANLAAHYHDPFSVGLGAVTALWTVSAIAVIGGVALLRYVNVRIIRHITAAVLLLLGGVATWSALA
jgi:putative Ca2+/H+ antiporter (TMEM165/GDT1 family)